MKQSIFRFGVDYYPEHWPSERWPVDAQLMAAAGFNTARLAEFAWSKLEPVPGTYDFDWLDQAIEILGQNGLQVVLGTPTGSPPPWIMHQHPDIFRVLETNQRQTYGNRRYYCPNNSTYHDYTRRIVAAMAEHYAGNPAVIAWQIDNEFGQGDRCCCPVCIAQFQEWLRAKYGTLDNLNQTWGTMFWSHVYTDWEQIPAPLKTASSPNPSLALDYYRFSSDSYVAYQKMQADIIRQYHPDALITHNLMGIGFGQLDYDQLAADLDFVTWDNYPRMQWTLEQGLDTVQVALSHDAMRGLKRQNYWVMEQQSGSGGWEIVSAAPRPGELRLWAYQSIAHGADGIIFFRWRTARHGTEQYWHGILDHHARPGRRYDEIQKMGAEIGQIGNQILDSQPTASVALLHSYDTRFAFQIQANNPNFDYPRHLLDIYRALHEQHIAVAVITPETDFSAYKLVIVPALYVLTEPVANQLKQFVTNGGTLVVTPRTGVKNEFNVVVDVPLPGLLADLCGVEIAEYDSLPSGVSNELAFISPAPYPFTTPAEASIWCDVLRPTTAEVIATYTRDYYGGQPAITLNRYGQGQVITIGTFATADLYRVLTPWFIATAGVTPTLTAPRDVEVTVRQHSGQTLTFILNHTDEPQTITLPHDYTSLLDNGKKLSGTVILPPKEILILRG
ncbi:MAG TPA: beta-galactosidase [Phototrophicaceae bacterium]|nr:beta-galactosidase [Phototrophicaceae bacterium]